VGEGASEKIEDVGEEECVEVLLARDSVSVFAVETCIELVFCCPESSKIGVDDGGLMEEENGVERVGIVFGDGG
jgi:hypothetical protein